MKKEKMLYIILGVVLIVLLIGNIYQFSRNSGLKNQIAETNVTIESLNEQLAEKDNIMEETQRETEEQETLISDLQSQIEALELAAEEEYTLTEMNKEMLVTQNSATYETPNPYTKVGEVQQDEIVKVIGAVDGSDWYQIEQSDGTVSFIDGIYLKEIEQSQEEQQQTEAEQQQQAESQQNQQEQQTNQSQAEQSQQQEEQQSQQQQTVEQSQTQQQTQTSQATTPQQQAALEQELAQGKSVFSSQNGVIILSDGTVIDDDGTVTHPGDSVAGGSIFIGADGSVTSGGLY